MRTLTEFINEEYYETDNWTYLYVQLSNRVNWFDSGYLSPQVESYLADNANFVVFSTKKNMSNHSASEFIMKQFEKKYGKKIDGLQVLCSSGDINTAKLIKKIGSALDKGNIQMVDFLNAYKSNHKLKSEPIEFLQYLCNKLNIKI